MLTNQKIKTTFSILLMISVFSSCVHKKYASGYSTDNISLTQDLNIHLRAEWQSVPVQDSLNRHEITHITVHHGGTEFSADKNVAMYLQNLQSWSRAEKKWMDIPYHFMMDLSGEIYEARPYQYPGDTNTSYDPTGHLLICVMGNYEVQKISDAQLTRLKEFISYFMQKYNVPFDKIKTHKDYTETACPGQDIYKYFEDGSLLREIAAEMEKAGI